VSDLLIYAPDEFAGLENETNGSGKDVKAYALRIARSILCSATPPLKTKRAERNALLLQVNCLF
jgi:hypothetical protein